MGPAEVSTQILQQTLQFGTVGGVHAIIQEAQLVPPFARGKRIDVKHGGEYFGRCFSLGLHVGVL
jgi:hypothetical protein